MESFKTYLLTEFVQTKSIDTEAMLVLQKIIDMVDDGHVDYSDNKIRLNIGKLIKSKRYNKLDLIIKTGSTSATIGRTDDGSKYAITLFVTKLPKREDIDQFLSDKSISAQFKPMFFKFANDTINDDVDDDSDYEKSKSLNTRTAFESSYVKLVDDLNKEFVKYKNAKKDIETRMEHMSDDLGDKELLDLSINKLKHDMLGKNVNEFKSKAIDIYGSDRFKLLSKEFKAKLDSRLSDYYDTKIK